MEVLLGVMALTGALWLIWQTKQMFWKRKATCPACQIKLEAPLHNKPIAHSCSGQTLAYSYESSEYLVPFEKSKWYKTQLIRCPLCDDQTPKFETYCLNCGRKPSSGAHELPYPEWLPKSKPKRESKGNK